MCHLNPGINLSDSLSLPYEGIQRKLLCIQQCFPFPILEGIRTPPKKVPRTSRPMTLCCLWPLSLGICSNLRCQHFTVTKVNASDIWRDHLLGELYATSLIMQWRCFVVKRAPWTRFYNIPYRETKSCSFSQCLDYDRQHSCVRTKTWIYNIIKWFPCPRVLQTDMFWEVNPHKNIQALFIPDKDSIMCSIAHKNVMAQ